MFERYTEEARRVVFFARFEAGRRDAAAISTPYIALGLSREGRSAAMASIGYSKRLKEHLDALRIPPVVNDKNALKDMPLDVDAKKTLALAASEADGDGSKRIEPEHILRGLLSFENAATDALKAAGFKLELVREASNTCGAGGRYLRRLNWKARLLFHESIWPALFRLAVLFVVGLFVALLLRRLNMR
jgi:ATP-dependent Clp protease ATP-binding subunit ClpC